ncbi:hypothetical protein SVIOM342S_07727 [Streptomyces violaceorubidus]
MGARRTHELAAVAAARSAYVGGFATTSDLAAGFRYNIPTVGTSAHAFTLLHDHERDAFRAQVDALGRDTTLLVDTYDVAEAVRTAVEVAGPELGAVRIDSGDLLLVAHRVRQQLDELGATETKIVVTSDLDEYAIASLAAAPVDAYGVGTQLVTGSGHPTASMVYKLVARAESGEEGAPLVPVAKKSSGGKTSIGGRKWAARRLDADGYAEAEVVGTGPVPDALADRQLLVELVKGGEVVAREPLDAARDRHAAARCANLPLSATQLSRGEPARSRRSTRTGARVAKAGAAPQGPYQPRSSWPPLPAPDPQSTQSKDTDHAPRLDRRRRAERLLRGGQSRRVRRCGRGRRHHRADRAGARRLPPRGGHPRPPRRPGRPLRRQPGLRPLLARALRRRHRGDRLPPKLRPRRRLRRDRRRLRQGGLRRRLQRLRRASTRTAPRPRRVAALPRDRRSGRRGHRHRPLRPGHRPGRRPRGLP